MSDDLSSAPLIRIVCAALRDCETGLVIPGPRHCDNVMRPLIAKAFGIDYWKTKMHDDGFLTNMGEFVDRQQAWVIAERAGQILYPGVAGGQKGTLWSENLY